MKKFSVNNGDRRIGHGLYSNNLLKHIKKTMTITGLTFGMGLALASCKPKTEVVALTAPIVIEPFDGYVPDAIYTIPLDDKTIVFTNKEGLREFGYTYDKDLDKANAWTEDKYQELMRKCELPNAVVDETSLQLLESMHQDYRMRCEEYANQGPSITRDKFMWEQYELFNKELKRWIGEEYKPEMIDLMEEDRINDLNEMDYYKKTHYNLDNYVVSEGETAYGIADMYADDAQQREEIIKEIGEINNLENVDEIQEGQVLVLPKVDEGDFDVLGCFINEADLVEQYNDYFQYIKDRGLQTITGDVQSDAMRDEISRDIDLYMKEIRNPDSEIDLIELAKETIKKIEVNFGIEGPTLTVHRGR